MSRPQFVVTSARRVDGPSVVDVPVILTYQAGDPYVVRLTFEDPQQGPIPWDIDRDLLHRGLTEHSGIGDVRIWPIRTRVAVAITSDEGSAVLHLARGPLTRFLLETFAVVAPGTEHVDIDTVIARILEDAL